MMHMFILGVTMKAVNFERAYSCTWKKIVFLGKSVDQELWLIVNFCLLFKYGEKILDEIKLYRFSQVKWLLDDNHRYMSKKL